MENYSSPLVNTFLKMNLIFDLRSETNTIKMLIKFIKL